MKSDVKINILFFNILIPSFASEDMSIVFIPKTERPTAGNTLSGGMDFAEMRLDAEPLCKHCVTQGAFELLPLVCVKMLPQARLSM